MLSDYATAAWAAHHLVRTWAKTQSASMQGLLGSAAPVIPGLPAPQGYTWGTWVNTLQQYMLIGPVSNLPGVQLGRCQQRVMV